MSFDLDNLFSYHPPHGDQAARYERIRAAAKAYAEVVIECTPPSADQSTAIRQICESCMTANTAIACNEAE